MKTTGFETAQRQDTHPVCLRQCLPAFVIGTLFFSTNTEKNQTKNEVTGGNGRISTHLGLIWGISG